MMFKGTGSHVMFFHIIIISPPLLRSVFQTETGTHSQGYRVDFHSTLTCELVKLNITLHLPGVDS